MNFTVSVCRFENGYIKTPDGKCICPPNTALNENDECIRCHVEKGFKTDERGRCVCDLEKGMIIDEHGNCICGYELDNEGNCKPTMGPSCETNEDCPDDQYCDLSKKTCVDPCNTKQCGLNAFCNATNHQAVCKCLAGYGGDADIYCRKSHFRHIIL